MLEVFNLRDIEDIDQGIRNVIGPGLSPEYTVEPRPSGIPVLLAYRGGSLSGAVTKRGPLGGKDVTRNIKTILTVPLSIDSAIGHKRPPDNLEVWGIAYDEGSSKNLLKSEDSMAASLVGADLKAIARRSLNLFCFGASGEPELGKQIGVVSHYELMLLLQDWGFRVNRPQISRCADISAVFETIRRIEESKGQYPYEVDGALVQVNPLPQRAAIEAAALTHGGVIAFMFTRI
jgi:DNA ligase (NAD+)